MLSEEEKTHSCLSLPTDKESKAAATRFKRTSTALLERLCDLPDAHHFKSPVPKSIAPDYALSIKQPICIRDVTRRVKEGLTRDRDELRRDVARIFGNAVQYNGLREQGGLNMGEQAQNVWKEFER